MGLAVGKRIPDVELFGPSGHVVRLAEARTRGPLVLVVYVLDFTAG